MAEYNEFSAEKYRIGMNIKNARTEKGLSQEQLAEILDVTNTHISYLETGTKSPSIETLVKLANALDVSADDLLVGVLNHSSSTVGKEMHTILQGCNRDEEKLLIRIAQFMKDLFIEFNI